MSANKPSSSAVSDDAPELDAHFFQNAEVRIGDRVVSEASDTMAKRGRGRPPKGQAAKVQQTLKLSPEVLEHFRAAGEGWQTRIDDALKHAALMGELSKLPIMALLYETVSEIETRIRFPSDNAGPAVGAAAKLRYIAGEIGDAIAAQGEPPAGLAAELAAAARGEQPPADADVERPLTLFEKMMTLSRGPARATPATGASADARNQGSVNPGREAEMRAGRETVGAGRYVKRDERTGRLMESDGSDAHKGSGRKSA